ncbi:DUF6157 family protein [Actinoplanes sp. NEAU-A12]|uniref:DUF6157 family protein n=1 Tax=Actinoplanes sandaracinus TaxID=3045177 RepID=A0ABT6WGJ1_9ACTN|nr:DUF6157 family protein [Actinoplanes sandaracinus]MDI6098845.1 DUF6157 family protein [Actinoplanes sandaracinus]
MHSTNYVNTFIQVAEDCTAVAASVPPERATASVAELTFRMIAEAPYQHTSDDVVFTVWADRRGVPEADRAAAREQFFAKGQPCLRSSDLGKRYGWGFHFDAAGRVALMPVGSAEYARLAAGQAPDGTPVSVTRAMRSRR